MSYDLTPGGRLTLVSGQPEMSQTADYTTGVLYYAPFKSDQVPLFDGAAWNCYGFTANALDTIGLSLAGSAAWAANSRRDVYATLENGVPILTTGPAWPSPNSLPAARGLVRCNGLWVNGSAISLDKSAAVSLSVPANQATYLGSINVGASAGSLQALFTLGQNRRCDVWNAYNQREVLLGVGQPPISGNIVQWKPDNQYSTAWKAFNNDPNNSGYYFTGLPQNVSVEYHQRGFVDSYSAGGACAMIFTVCKGSLATAVGSQRTYSSDLAGVEMSMSGTAVYKDRSACGLQQVFMGTGNANTLKGVTMWGLTNSPTRAPEDTHVMWISHMG